MTASLMSSKPSAARPRLIERWFPCAEVSAASSSGWGSSNSETLLMSWFAKRPLAQSRAAVLCSLLPWPNDTDEQSRVQAVVREALGHCQDPDWFACRRADCSDLDCTRKSHMEVRGPSVPHAHGILDCARLDSTKGYNAARRDVLLLLEQSYPDRPATTLDPFAGRGLIPIEAARYGQEAHAIDYSPVATLASRLLIDWPFRDWSHEPQLPFETPADQTASFIPTDSDRLVRDIGIVQGEVQRRISADLDEFYPDNDRGEKPWGYLWASVINCNECGREFPLYSSPTLQRRDKKSGRAEISLELHTEEDRFWTEVHDGPSESNPTMRSRPNGKRGKLAWCPFRDCGHGHELPEHKAMVACNFQNLAMLAVADLDGTRKVFRVPTAIEVDAANAASRKLAETAVNGMAGRPLETLVQGSSRMMAVHYGAKTFGDLSVDRQNLLHASISQAIADLASEMVGHGNSEEYASALAGYCAAVLARKLKRSTRGARLQTTGGTRVGDIFVNESTIAFNYDFFEAGVGKGPGTWQSVASVPAAVAELCVTAGRAADVQRGSALNLPFDNDSLDAVVTDPPYDAMINYSDASDLYYVWLKRALGAINPDFSMTSHPHGTQENDEEIIVSHYWDYTNVEGEHRTPERYDRLISDAFAECERVVHPDGVVTIVFGHGEPEVWRRILDAISQAGLMLTGAWPANTEKGGAAGSANINTTLTLACRPAPENRPDGRAAVVDAEMRQVIEQRVHEVWDPSGLSYVDQKMAAAGPALEVVGRYERILDKRGQPVDLTRYLPLARQAVTEAHDLRFDSLPLETFDQKTRFALEWTRAYGRRVQAKSEARWQRLAAELEDHETDGVLHETDSGVRLIFSKESAAEPQPGNPLFEVALIAAARWKEGTLADAAAAIRSADVDPADQHFWAVLSALSQGLPDTDVDGAAWTSMVRNREALVAGIASAEYAATATEAIRSDFDRRNPALFKESDTLFNQIEGD
ncbi:MAG: DUF1156 domain-containing protein [Acidimicrobiia bacterium]|jgi:putative DNA methylase|nr:DUF1156 domain-containing protein [Acidimicrobiia bacterium]